MFNRFHQLIRSSAVGTALCLLPAFAALPAEAHAASSVAVATPTSSASPDLVVLEVKGTVQTSTDDGNTWTPVNAGLRVAQGDWFRTGYRSSVTCGIALDRAFTLESLSAIRVDPAILNGNHYKTDFVKHGAFRVGTTAESVEVKIDTPSEPRGAEQQVGRVDAPTPMAVGADPLPTEACQGATAWTLLWTVLAGVLGYCLSFAGRLTMSSSLTAIRARID